MAVERMLEHEGCEPLVRVAKQARISSEGKPTIETHPTTESESSATLLDSQTSSEDVTSTSEEEEDDDTSSSGSEEEGAHPSNEAVNVTAPPPLDDTQGTSDSDSSTSSSTSITNVTVAKKPPIQKPHNYSSTSSDLHSRLASFLPSLAAANEELEHDRAAGTLGQRDIENVDNKEDSEGGDESGDGDGEGGGYIEMNLGLGVLEEQRDGMAESDSSSSEDEEEGDEATEDDEGDKALPVTTLDDGSESKPSNRAQRERDTMGRLMGSRRRKPAIEELNGG